VTAQVGDQINGKWRNIDQTKRKGEPAALTLERNGENEWLYFDLDCFRPIIGNYRYGKLTLPNGANAIFEMSNLAPPSRTVNAWDTQLLHPEPDPLIQRPFVIASIGSMGEDLRAVCAYLDMEGTSATSV